MIFFFEISCFTLFIQALKIIRNKYPCFGSVLKSPVLASYLSWQFFYSPYHIPSQSDTESHLLKCVALFMVFSTLSSEETG